MQEKQEDNICIQDLLNKFVINYAEKAEKQCLDTFYSFLLSSNLPEKECCEILGYYRKLIENNSHYFNTAIDILIRTQKFWPLKSISLEFFHQLKFGSTALFDELLQELHHRCDAKQDNLFLRAYHLDIVIDMLNKRRELFQISEDENKSIAQLAEEYLDETSPDIEKIVRDFREENLKKISKQAKDAYLMHHTINHAFEIRIRAMYIAEKLGIFGTSKLDSFLKEIIRLSIEYHDGIQGNSGDYSTVEQASAAAVSDYLIQSLKPPPFLEKLSRYVVESTIGLGTTMVFSPNRTMDLWELFFSLLKKESAVNSYEMKLEDQRLFNKFEAVSILTGVCDKTPTAIFDIVKAQTDQEKTNSLHNLALLTDTSLLFEFFEHGGFTPYYPHQENKYNYQAFLITVIPHMCMPAELNVTKQPEHALNLINFIKTCQKEAKNESSNEKYFEFFNKFFDQNVRTSQPSNIIEAINALFIEKLESEQKFCNSQAGGLMAALENIKETGFVDNNGELWVHIARKITFEQREEITNEGLPPISNPASCFISPVIDPKVSTIDGENLIAFGNFFKSKSLTEQHQLIKLLVLNTVFQAGMIYVKNQELELTTAQPVSPVNCATPSPVPVKGLEQWGIYASSPPALRSIREDQNVRPSPR